MKTSASLTGGILLATLSATTATTAAAATVTFPAGPPIASFAVPATGSYVITAIGAGGAVAKEPPAGLGPKSKARSA